MLNLPSAIKIYLCTQATDMRRSFDGLAMMVKHIIKQNPLSGHIFVFHNKRKNMLKILYWDNDGYAIWYKRLEKGKFVWPGKINDDNIISSSEFAMMLEGIDFSKIARNKRFKL